MNQLVLINPDRVSEEEVKKYKTREAVRAVVYDQEGRIAILHVTNKNHYKLPGGGIEDGENQLMALERECLEETGSNIEVVGEIGIVIEYRKSYNLKQTSFCYVAKVKGEKGKPNFTEHELDRGFKILWMPINDLDKFIYRGNLDDSKVDGLIIPRDSLLILEAIKNSFIK